MKQTIPLVFLCWFISIFNLHGQDSSALNDTFPPSEAKLFSLKVPESSMLKLDLVNLVQQANTRGIIGMARIAYEQKLKTSWSLNGELSTSYILNFDPKRPANMLLDESVIGVGFGTRYYHNLQQRINEGKNADNLSANYFSFMAGTRLKPSASGWTATDRTSTLYTDNISLYYLYGMQRRIFSFGFMDFNIGFKFSYGDPPRSTIIIPRDAENGWQFIPITSFRIGLAL